MKNDFYIVKKHYVTLCSLMDVIFFTSYIHFIYIHKLMHHPIIILHNYFIILTTQRNFINFTALTLCPLVLIILINITFQPHSNRREYARNLNMVKFLILACSLLECVLQSVFVNFLKVFLFPQILRIRLRSNCHKC